MRPRKPRRPRIERLRIERGRAKDVIVVSVHRGASRRSVVTAADRPLEPAEALLELEDVLRPGEIRLAIAHLLPPEPAVDALEDSAGPGLRGPRRLIFRLALAAQWIEYQRMGQPRPRTGETRFVPEKVCGFHV